MRNFQQSLSFNVIIKLENLKHFLKNMETKNFVAKLYPVYVKISNIKMCSVPNILYFHKTF